MTGAGHSLAPPSFDGLSGWNDDDLAAAWAAFSLGAPGSGPAPDAPAQSIRQHIETTFRPGATIPAHATGYFEPELRASRSRSADFPVPIHALPDSGCTLARSDIGSDLDGLALAWLPDEVDRFFLQVQGSGRLMLDDGTVMRVGYAGKNRHPYRSIGKVVMERPDRPAQMSADTLAAWLRADPDRGRAVMDLNPSYVFFRVIDSDPQLGPIGTQGVPVSAGRSIAVDPEHVPLGSLVWVDVGDVRRLCVAQDTGSAIKGPGRIDVFIGTGAKAGGIAGGMNDRGHITPLLPR